jgi:hypothetical protein
VGVVVRGTVRVGPDVTGFTEVDVFVVRWRDRTSELTHGRLTVTRQLSGHVDGLAKHCQVHLCALHVPF